MIVTFSIIALILATATTSLLLCNEKKKNNSSNRRFEDLLQSLSERSVLIDKLENELSAINASSETRQKECNARIAEIEKKRDLYEKHYQDAIHEIDSVSQKNAELAGEVDRLRRSLFAETSSKNALDRELQDSISQVKHLKHVIENKENKLVQTVNEYTKEQAKHEAFLIEATKLENPMHIEPL